MRRPVGLILLIPPSRMQTRGYLFFTRWAANWSRYTINILCITDRKPKWNALCYEKRVKQKKAYKILEVLFCTNQSHIGIQACLLQQLEIIWWLWKCHTWTLLIFAQAGFYLIVTELFNLGVISGTPLKVWNIRYFPLGQSNSWIFPNVQAPPFDGIVICLPVKVVQHDLISQMSDTNWHSFPRQGTWGEQSPTFRSPWNPLPS